MQSVRILPSDVPREGATSGFRGSTVPIHGFTEEKNPKEATQTNTQTACFLHAREYIAEIFKNLYVYVRNFNNSQKYIRLDYWQNIST